MVLLSACGLAGLRLGDGAGVESAFVSTCMLVVRVFNERAAP
jgi:hypothetical protein